MKSILAAIFAATTLLAGCQKTATTGSDLLGTTEIPTAGVWELKSFDLSGGQSIAVTNPSSYTLELGGDGQAHIRADCNVCNGSYVVSGPTLRLGLLACTRAACPPDSLDDRYLQALGSVSSLERAGDELRIAYDGGTLRYGLQ